MEFSIFWGGELSNEPVLREEFDDLLEEGPRSERPDGRSLSFDLDGGFVDGLLAHSVLVICDCVIRGGW